MRGSFLDFTRGSQVAETVGMMFGTALRPMLWTLFGILVAAVSYQLWKHTQHGDSYYWMMHSYAASWHYFEFNPTHLIGLKMAAGDTVRVPISLINTYPPLIDAWTRLVASLRRGGEIGIALGIPVAIITTIVLRRFGQQLTERKHTRGASLESVAVLATAVGALNDVASASDRRAIAAKLFGRAAPIKALLPASKAAIEAELHIPYRIADVEYPWRAEQSHTMIVGTTGTGKSTAMKDLLRQIKMRGDRAVVFDLTGTYVEGFYNPKTDVLLNPFDTRCPAWSPFADAHTREHFKEVSQALIPMSEGGGDSFWQETARMLFVETCVRLVEQGRGNNAALAAVLMTSKLKDLHAHVARTIAAPLTDPEAKRMAESIRATFNTYAQALMTLPDEGAMFSIRDWVLGIDHGARDSTDEGLDVIAELTGNAGVVAAPGTGGPGSVGAASEAPGEPAKPVYYDAATGEVLDLDPDDLESLPARSVAIEGPAAASPEELAAVPPTAEGSILFVAAQHVNLRSVRVLLTMWITTAINTLMSMRGDQRDIRLWFLIDEIGALHNIPAIVAGMQTSRNYGGAFVLGVHTMAQLKETYGDNNAETISSLAKTKLLMNTRDRGTQEWESEQVGEGEWSEMEENWSYGVDNVRDAATLQKKIKLEPLVLPTEFGELPDLHGYLKFPQGLPAARVKLTYVKYKRQAIGFDPRVLPALELPGFGDGDGDRDEAPAETSAKAPAAVARTTGGSVTEGDGTAATVRPSDGGEGFQTAVASEPPERTPGPSPRIFAGPRDVVAEPITAVLTALDPRNLNQTTGDTAAAAAVPKDAAIVARDPAPDGPSLPSERSRETVAPSLGIQELRLNLTGKGYAQTHHRVSVGGRESWFETGRTARREAVVGRPSPAVSRDREIVTPEPDDELSADLGRGDDVELGR